jgi:hypothetical protein
VGSVETVATCCISSQPVTAFTWSASKPGLFACAALDQCIHVGVVTRVGLL